MDLTASLDVRCPPERLTAWIRDLGRYPSWLSIVPRAEPEAEPPPDGRAAWSVELRARFGPLARSKRLRMVRIVDESSHVRFERDELDGRRHSPWVLDARTEPSSDGSRLVMDLHYGGSMNGMGLLQRLLGDEIESSKPRLRALVEDAPTDA